MEALIHSSWGAYPAALLIAVGVALAAAAVRRWRAAACLDRDPERALAYALGFRTGILGLCAVAFGFGWLWQIAWLLVLSLIVLGEEMLEIGVMIAALRAATRPRLPRLHRADPL